MDSKKSIINYEGMGKWLYSRPRLVLAAKWCELVLSAFVAAAYVVFGALMALIDSPLRTLVYIIVTGVSFFALSMLRVWLDAKRPYEVYDFASLGITVGGRGGRSFPSRHVFSAFIIGTLILPSMLWLGIITLIFGTIIGFIRVVTCKHFVRDVLAGAAIGAVLGAVGIISMALI